ncbi:MAG: AGE family epimerase/isomerase [Bryobacterales bacterium]|nr:AGE family epimerase/isomerase [Bryobacterales bacterium]
MLHELAARYRSNLFDSVIPFWMNHSLDRVHGGQFHCLARDGHVFDTRKYVWMQGRAVWMFSRLYNRVEPRPEWRDAAALILRFLDAHATAPDGTTYFSLSEAGLPAFQQRKPYAAFFHLLALAEYSRTDPGAGHLPRARQLYHRVLHWMNNPSSLGRPALPGQPPMRALADVYVKAFMALELRAVDPDPCYDDLLRQCLSEAREHWLPSRRTLVENKAERLDSPDARLLCPGSALEVAWLMWHVLEALQSQDSGYERFLLDVIEGSLEAGWDREHGGLFYFLDAAGEPPLQLEANMKLWWPHTEAIYALILAYSKTRDEKWLRWLERVDSYSFSTFVDWEHGEWFGYCDRYGNTALDLKGGPYKGFFHVPRCLLFSLQRLGEIA